MSRHLFGLIATPYGIAANNRGENDGNITTLQKLLWNGEIHTTVSAEAIRWAIRYYWQRKGLPVNREWLEEENDHRWTDPRWLAWTDPDGKGKGRKRCIDDDVLGYMVAEAAKEDGSDTPGSAIKRRGPLEVTRAISLTPFAGDITFNAKSGTKTNTSLYGTEVHATRYQYGFGLTPAHLHDPAHALAVVEAVGGLSEVAGNQSRFLFDFSPEAVIFRWTEDFAPRMLYGFQLDEHGRLDLPAVLGRVLLGDLDPAELVVGLGRPDLLAESASDALKRHGIEPVGIRQAAATVCTRMTQDLALPEPGT
ncbi:type I-B CRISPR-associated protein Cas7/Cst2/DevR [Methylolobus aquaticus]|nr:type I-B CRISPR-associated protein Cas7/Cst2/DevR [Methylolobus aquaticus]